MRLYHAFLAAGFWVLNLYTCVLTLLLDAPIATDVQGILLHHGRPDMHVLTRVLEDMEQNDRMLEIPVPYDNLVKQDTDDTNYHDRDKRYAMDVEKIESRRWTYGVIPYTFATELGDGKRIQNVFDIIEYWTHFRFLPWNESLPLIYNLPHRNYLKFISDKSCWSYVGNHRYQKGQMISCCIGGISCLHEIFHAIGFHHEHSNPLRDEYMRVNTDNIIDRYAPYFGVRRVPTDRAFGYFDMSSVMAYPNWAFSKNKRDVITVYDKEMEYLLQRKDATGYYMFYEAQTMYRMKDQKCPEMNDTCANGGYISFLNGECRCRCPDGLDPSTQCTTLSATGYDKCGNMVYLSDDRPTINIVTPGYPNVLTGEQRCNWFIKAPENTTVSLDFNEFEITSKHADKCDNHLEIRHLLPGQPGNAYCGSGFKRTITSEVNIVSLLLKSSNSAIFNVTVKLIKGLCYTNGAKDNSYKGTVNVTEDFRSCLPWSQVTHCRMNTFNVRHMELVENYCRNPGFGTKPWCYVDADTCGRAYCDVCQIKKCYDLFDDCDDLLTSNSQYCEEGLDASRGCRKTCDLCNDEERIELVSEISCGIPPIVLDGDTIQSNKQVYKVGDIVTYRCLYNRSITVNVTCTSAGSWPYVSSVCKDEKICADQRTDCVQLLERNPTLCFSRRAFMTIECAKTCALCQRMFPKVCRDQGTSYNTFAMSPRFTRPGGVIVRRCMFGYELSSGNVYRACKPDGTLTGQLPKCLGMNEITSESYHVPLRRRKFTGGKNQAIVLNHIFYRIRRSGEITGWKFYSNYAGRVVFQVWSYNDRTKRYRLEGENTVRDTKSDRLVQFNVPAHDRIPVYPDLLLGVYFDMENPGGIPHDDCVTQYDPQGANVVELNIDGNGIPVKNSLYSVKQKLSCRLYSFSAIIGPMAGNDENQSERQGTFGFMQNYFQQLRNRWTSG